ncbi:hypothetical protein GHT06_010856 [Daphnia sinensis]|uniref:Hexosyltransferase n=1 Tax=Daphnia sinensis TaxID=1820382 RepID=A0AAD5LJE0_9CRUS|nr:hypothetical protein GHT06_010856 [Daphnia sinensis]
MANLFRNRQLSLLPSSLVYTGLILNIGMFTFNVVYPLDGYLQNKQIAMSSYSFQQRNIDVYSAENEQLSENQTLDQCVSMNRDLFNYMAPNLFNTSYPGVETYTKFAVARLGLSTLKHVEPLKPEYGPVINDVTSFNYPISIAPCRNVTNAANRTVFVVVVSAPDNFEKRDVIRETWRTHLMEENKKHMFLKGFAFFLGRTENNVTQSKIEEEDKIHGDIIQLDMLDTYKNLSVKVAGLFNWLHRNCATIDFVFKVDDDVYVNVRNLVFFAQLTPYDHYSNKSIFGIPGFFSPNRGGKWGISYQEWPWNQYPPYMMGPTVLIPGGTIVPLLAAFQTTPMIPFDDVYYTGICTEKAGIKTRFSRGDTAILSMMWGKPHQVPDPCGLRKFLSWLTRTGQLMKKLHVVTDHYYHDRTTCIVPGVNGTKKIISHNEPVHFYFH